MLSDIRKAVEESAKKLFQVSSPPVRLWLLMDAMKREDTDPMVQKILDECRKHPPRIRLLDSQRDDGTWSLSRQRRLQEESGPGPPIGWTYITMLRNLHALGDMHTEPGEGNVGAALEKLLSWQNGEGYIPGPWSAAYPLPHYNGYALRNLIQFQMEDDPRTQRIIRWLLSTQRSDGGWNIPYIQDVRYLPAYRHLKINDFRELVDEGKLPPYDPDEFRHVPSCIWSTMMVVRGLAWSETFRKAREVRVGAEFFLDHFFKRNHHPSLLQSEKNWTTLKYPTYLGSGLCALDILTMMGYGPEDGRMERPVRWLLGARSKDGFWYRSERPHPDVDQWITATAICILARYAEVY